MRLYKMELYKLCHRKLFVIGAVFVIGIQIFSFCMQVRHEAATVDGIRYTGYRAVQVNRRITEEFRGVLTDEKIDKIIEKYGFPYYNVGEDGSSFMHDNFLNAFIYRYLLDRASQEVVVDGYSQGRIVLIDGAMESICSIADSDLGAVRELTGQEIILEYYEGWNIFFSTISDTMVMGGILILLGISIIFANEGQTKMLQLIFTTKEGRKKEVYAKIAAAMTIAVGVWSAIFLLNLLLCGALYGLDGLDCYNGMVTGYLLPMPDRMIPMRSYIMAAVMLSFFGIVSLCAITICISAHTQNNLHALSVAATCYAAPVMVAIFANKFTGILKVLYAAPIFMVMHSVIGELYNVWALPLGIAILGSIVCTIKAYRKYSRQQWL